jgi:hypothetical protein
VLRREGLRGTLRLGGTGESTEARVAQRRANEIGTVAALRCEHACVARWRGGEGWAAAFAVAWCGSGRKGTSLSCKERCWVVGLSGLTARTRSWDEVMQRSREEILFAICVSLSVVFVIGVFERLGGQACSNT